MVALILDPLGSLEGLAHSLPKGRGLPEHIWTRRHSGLLALLWLHVLGLAILGVAQGYGSIHSVGEAAIVALFGVAGSQRRTSRRFRSIMVAFGLLSSSALIVHLTGGLTESHFHFFVIVPLLTLYADWPVFLLAIGFVAVHHGVFGLLQERAVFNHPEAWSEPWKWALVHAAYVLAASAAAIVSWRANEERVLRDGLTQLPNASSFFEQANRARARAMRRSEHFGVLSVDLDGFKKVNDTLGHAAGDQLLIGVGDRLRASVRDSDIPARLGGDEFAILLENIDSLEQAERIASRVIQVLAQPFKLKGQLVSISASLGLGVSDGEGRSAPNDVLKEADDAMYVAKRATDRHYAASPHASLVLQA